jgi:diacylglycerol kinase
MKNKKPSGFSIKKRAQSFGNAFNGIVQTMRNEHNFRIHLMVMLLVIIFGFALKVSTNEWLVIILCSGMVLSAEIFNSAIENLTDIISPEQNPKAGLAKDMAAAAVLVSAIAAAIAGLIIFVPKLFELLLS